MTTQTKQEVYNRHYRNTAEEATWALVDAMCETYRALTGKWPTDKMRDDIYYAVRH